MVHRRGGADRYRRPLHDAGIELRGRRQRLGRLPRPLAQVAAAPADQRCAAHRQHPGPAAADAGRAQGPRRQAAGADPGARRKARRSRARLCAHHQGRPDRRLQRELRGAEQGGPQPGLGLQLPLRADQHRRSAGQFRFRVLGPREAPARSRRAFDGCRARGPEACRHLQLSATVRGASRPARRLPRAGLQRRRHDGGATAPARRLLHQRHPGRHADRSRPRHAGANLRHRAAAGAAGGRARQELLPQPAAQRRCFHRAGSGRREPGDGTASRPAAPRRFRDRAARKRRPDRRLGAELCAQQELHRRDRNEASRAQEDRRRSASGDFRRRDAGATGADRSPHRSALCRLPARLAAALDVARPVPGQEARCGRRRGLPASARPRADAARRASPRGTAACRQQGQPRAGLRSAEELPDDLHAGQVRRRRVQGLRRRRLGCRARTHARARAAAGARRASRRDAHARRAAAGRADGQEPRRRRARHAGRLSARVPRLQSPEAGPGRRRLSGVHGCGCGRSGRAHRVRARQRRAAHQGHPGTLHEGGLPQGFRNLGRQGDKAARLRGNLGARAAPVGHQQVAAARQGQSRADQPGAASLFRGVHQGLGQVHRRRARRQAGRSRPESAGRPPALGRRLGACGLPPRCGARNDAGRTEAGGRLHQRHSSRQRRPEGRPGQARDGRRARQGQGAGRRAGADRPAARADGRRPLRADPPPRRRPAAADRRDPEDVQRRLRAACSGRCGTEEQVGAASGRWRRAHQGGGRATA